VRLLGAACEPDVVEPVGDRSGVQLYVCWVADVPASQAHDGDPEAVLLHALDWLRETYREQRFTAKFPVCLPEEIARDVDSIRRLSPRASLAWDPLLDEGGYWRTRRTPPQGDCRLWGSDTKKRKAPAMFVTRVAAEGT
jgi:hypothetical protein